MGCTCESHTMHVCYLKQNGRDADLRAVTDAPTVFCSHCGAKANGAQYLCAAHLGETAPNVEGGHGNVGLDQVGKPHAGGRE